MKCRTIPGWIHVIFLWSKINSFSTNSLLSPPYYPVSFFKGKVCCSYVVKGKKTGLLLVLFLILVRAFYICLSFSSQHISFSISIWADNGSFHICISMSFCLHDFILVWVDDKVISLINMLVWYFSWKKFIDRLLIKLAVRLLVK